MTSPNDRATRRQCKACPWRKDVDAARDIPGGYCARKHAGLRKTLGTPLDGQLRVMACHETPIGKEKPCVGWLANQLGPGHNLALRLATLQDRSLLNFELVGDQHEHFDDTLPKGVR
jgi:hypothetical protein